MTHEYKITGMTCQGCRAKVEKLLKEVDHVTKVDVNLENSSATISMDRHVDTAELKKALAGYPKYELFEMSGHTGNQHLPKSQHQPMVHETPADAVPSDPDFEDKKSTWETYKPVFLIGIYLTLITLLIQFAGTEFHLMSWMNHFMGGFFIIFSFFKMFDLNGFADSYSMYDIIAKKWRPWGYIYPFVELGLGLLFITGIISLVTNIITLVVMTLSIIGVLQSVLNKRKIKCACLGAVFNLPMSTVTIIEDGMMVVMSGFMLLLITS